MLNHIDIIQIFPVSKTPRLKNTVYLTMDSIDKTHIRLSFEIYIIYCLFIRLLLKEEEKTKEMEI